MSIEASHWGMIVARVTAHARKLYPRDKKKQQRLIDELLCVVTSEGLEQERCTALPKSRSVLAKGVSFFR